MQTSDRRRWFALYVLCAGMLMIVLDATIVNVALPSIAKDLHFRPTDLAWVINAYLIAFGGLLLLAGRIGDLIGQRKVFLTGLIIFVAASLACALAPNSHALVGARLVQGIGGALTSAVVLGMIVSMFPEPAERAKAIGVYGFVASAGGSIGLISGGVLTSAFDWRWIFLINLPIGIATGILAMRWVDGRDAGLPAAPPADGLSAALLTGGLMTGVYAILQVSRESAAVPLTAGAIALVLLAVFVVRQTRIPAPLLPLRVFRSRTVSGANVVQALLVIGMFGTFFLGALYLQDVRGYGPLRVGLAFLPATVVMGLMSLRLSAVVTEWIGPHRTLLTSLVVLVAGLLLFARVPVGGSYLVDIAPATALIGLGAGLGFPALTGLAMSAASPEDAGLASGLFNTTVQVGGAVGLAVLSAVATHRTDALTAAGDGAASALTGGYHLAFLIAALAVVAATVIAATALRPATVPVQPLEPEPEPAAVAVDGDLATSDGRPAESLVPGWQGGQSYGHLR
jgi:EmrB/QacA subfamily drug resistance transporter